MIKYNGKNRKNNDIQPVPKAFTFSFINSIWTWDTSLMDRTSPTGFSNAIENWHNGFHNNASWPNFHDPRLNIRDDRFWQFHKFIDNRFKKWLKDNDDFNESCGRDRDEILSEPGGTDSQNIVGFRTDGIDWSFKYLSAREIDPLAEAV